VEMKQCRICGKEKELTLFEIDSRKKTKYTNRCRQCKNALDDKAQRAYRSLKQRSAKVNIPMEVTPREIRLLFDVFEGKCAYCGERPEKERNLHLEHIVPLSEYGRNTLSNLLPACVHCNLSKGNKPLVTHFLDKKFPDDNFALVVDYIALLTGGKKGDVVRDLTDEHIGYLIKQERQALDKEITS
jgi:5-methylcytosine-specific restriction endonuclease McrA